MLSVAYATAWNTAERYSTLRDWVPFPMTVD
jgi:hypothetical protein